MRNRSTTRDRRCRRALVAGVAAGIAMFGIGAGVARAANGPSEETSTPPASMTSTTPGEQTAVAPLPAGGADGVESTSQSSAGDPATEPASAESPATTPPPPPTTSSDEPALSVDSAEPETTEPPAPV